MAKTTNHDDDDGDGQHKTTLYAEHGERETTRREDEIVMARKLKELRASVNGPKVRPPPDKKEQKPLWLFYGSTYSYTPAY